MDRIIGACVTMQDCCGKMMTSSSSSSHSRLAVHGHDGGLNRSRISVKTTTRRWQQLHYPSHNWRSYQGMYQYGSRIQVVNNNSQQRRGARSVSVSASTSSASSSSSSYLLLSPFPLRPVFNRKTVRNEVVRGQIWTLSSSWLGI